MCVQYAVWLVVWVGWNAFIICFYLEVGHLSQVSKRSMISSVIVAYYLPKVLWFRTCFNHPNTLFNINKQII